MQNGCVWVLQNLCLFVGMTSVLCKCIFSSYMQARHLNTF